MYIYRDNNKIAFKSQEDFTEEDFTEKYEEPKKKKKKCKKNKCFVVPILIGIIILLAIYLIIRCLTQKAPEPLKPLEYKIWMRRKLIKIINK